MRDESCLNNALCISEFAYELSHPSTHEKKLIGSYSITIDLASSIKNDISKRSTDTSLKRWTASRQSNSIQILHTLEDRTQSRSSQMVIDLKNLNLTSS